MISRSNHMLSGIRWTLITSVIRRLITLVMFYFVARWLSQDDLGVFRAYNLILVLVTMMANLSLDFHYIIERKQVRSSLLALWQISLLSGLLAFVLLTAGAGIIGHLYKSNNLTTLFRFTSIFIIIEIFRKAVRAVAQKKQQFQALARAETANVVFYSILAVVGLFYYRSISVYLVVFYLGNAVELIWLWILNRREIAQVNKKSFQLSYLKILWLNLVRNRSFLSVATLVAGLNQLAGNAPILILGMFTEPVYMGMFYFASQIVGVPVGMFTTAVNQVFFPVFAGQQDADISKISARYVRLVGSLGLPLLMLFSFLAMYAIGWLFGSKWTAALPLLPVMVLLYGSNLYCSSISGIPFAKRKPEWELYWNIISLILRVGAMLAGLSISFQAAMWAYAISSAVMYFAFYLMSMHLVNVRLSIAFRDVFYSLIPAVGLSVVLYAAGRLGTVGAIAVSVLGTVALILAINLIGKGALWSDVKLISGWKSK